MPRNNQNWTDELDKRLMELVANGADKSAIAAAMNRTKAAIETRVSVVKKRLREKQQT